MNDPGYVRAAAIAQLPAGTILAVKVGDEEVVLYNVDGEIYATRDCCTHQSYPLSKGTLRGKYVTCALHCWVYDVTTGRLTEDPRRFVRSFPVKVDAEGIWVGREPLPPPPPPAETFVSRHDA